MAGTRLDGAEDGPAEVDVSPPQQDPPDGRPPRRHRQVLLLPLSHGQCHPHPHHSCLCLMVNVSSSSSSLLSLSRGQCHPHPHHSCLCLMVSGSSSSSSSSAAGCLLTVLLNSQPKLDHFASNVYLYLETNIFVAKMCYLLVTLLCILTMIYTCTCMYTHHCCRCWPTSGTVWVRPTWPRRHWLTGASSSNPPLMQHTGHGTIFLPEHS